MVTRTGEPLTVSEEQLAAALRELESVLESYGVTADFEVGRDWDPEDPSFEELTRITAHVRTPMETERFVDLIESSGNQLASVGLNYPKIPVSLYIRPAW
ncbi:MAG: hypothetical protein U5Q44_10600 [Dehalococcoidia bacterium]|nr:hypothetical protein [Dehalococcoidia bacterium]